MFTANHRPLLAVPFLLIASLVGASLIAVPIDDARAQLVPPDWPTLGVTLPDSCSQAPMLFEAFGYMTELGIYDVWIYPFIEWFDAVAVRFGITYPPEWIPLGVEICHGTVLAGQIWTPVSGVTLELEGDPSAAHIRLRLNATTPGRISFMRDPATLFFGHQTSNGDWVPYFGADNDAFHYIEIGERCDWRPIGVADFCGVHWGHRPAGWSGGFETDLTLPPGVTHVDTVTVRNSTYVCTSPVCGPGLPTPCFGGMGSDVPWVALALLEILGDDERLYALTIDTHGLPEGMHIGNVIVEPFCGLCYRDCREVRLNVGPVAVETTSWGRIKSQYRE